jgi:hypothetical protein
MIAFNAPHLNGIQTLKVNPTADSEMERKRKIEVSAVAACNIPAVTCECLSLERNAVIYSHSPRHM